MTTYKPFFYIIQNTHNGMYYAGAKWSKTTTDPNQFMKDGGYITSSGTIHKIIQEHGLDVFVIRRLRIFISGEEAFKYETRFLRKVNAKDNPMFYNLHNNDGFFDRDLARQRMVDVLGVENAFQSESVKAKIKQTLLINMGVDNAFKSPVVKQKSKMTKLERYNDENYNNREKAKNTWLQIYGVNHPKKTLEVNEKMKSTCMERYGVEYYVITEEFKKKKKQTLHDTYGVDNISQTEEWKEKVKANRKIKIQRPQVTQIKMYCKKYKITIGKGWYQQSDEKLNIVLDDLRKQYGEI